MINNLGATAGSTHFGGSLDTLPRGYRRIFEMKRFELEVPIQHPTHFIEHVAYRQRAYRIMGWGHPWVKIWRSLEELWLNLRHGNLGYIWQSFVRRVKKLMGKEEFKKTAGDILRTLRASEKAPGKDRIYTAGEKEYLVWLERKDKGVPVGDSVQKELIEIRNTYNLPYTFPFEE